MDNLTHSMLGAVLGQTGLKKKTGLGMAALIIGANIPDIDAACTLMGTQSLVLRRGITHGVLAMMILPLILTAILMQFDISQTRRGTRPPDRLPVRPGWLLLLSFIGTASHPLLDSFNSYGVRMMAPFSSRWFYGDMLFIIDTNKEAIAVQEANKLSIPVAAVIDSNSDPTGIAFPIPGNDDALRAIELYCELVAGAVLGGIETEMVASGTDIGELETPTPEDLPGETEAAGEAAAEPDVTAAAPAADGEAATQQASA